MNMWAQSFGWNWRCLPGDQQRQKGCQKEKQVGPPSLSGKWMAVRKVRREVNALLRLERDGMMFYDVFMNIESVEQGRTACAIRCAMLKVVLRWWVRYFCSWSMRITIILAPWMVCIHHWPLLIQFNYVQLTMLQKCALGRSSPFHHATNMCIFWLRE